MTAARILSDRLTLLELKQENAGFDGFLSSWIYRGSLSFVVDVGPASSASQLVDYLRGVGMKPDAVLLTHLHIDHAGGLGILLGAFPEAVVVCHERAVRHLTAPGPLWEGSRKALGEVALMYGEPSPVPAEKLIPHTRADLPGIKVIDAPGHAAHHLCFRCGGLLFAGEAGGVHLPEESPDYMRPSTPPRFFLGSAVESIEFLVRGEDSPMCYAHFGMAESSRKMLARHKDQLLLWKRLIEEERKNPRFEDRAEACLARVREEDPGLAALAHMNPAKRERELFFLRNSVQGFLGFLDG